MLYDFIIELKFKTFFKVCKIISDIEKTENKYSLVFLKFIKSEYYLSQNGVKSFLAENPYLVKNIQQTGAGSGANGNTAKIYTKEQINDMSPEQINENWADIQESMKSF